MISRQYQKAMHEFGTNVKESFDTNTSELASAKRELEATRKRIVDLIKEKSDAENFLVNEQMKHRELRESILSKDKRVKEFQSENANLMNRLH
jgi:chromosome segregation ATPase